MTPVDHITVCICTYRRPRMLMHLLGRLQNQDTDGQFTYSLVVVDNDAAESARPAVEACMQQSAVPMRYLCEPERNISSARNRAVTSAAGAFVALIDDDEFPEESWLL